MSSEKRLDHMTNKITLLSVIQRNVLPGTDVYTGGMHIHLSLQSAVNHSYNPAKGVHTQSIENIPNRSSSMAMVPAKAYFIVNSFGGVSMLKE